MGRLQLDVTNLDLTKAVYATFVFIPEDTISALATRIVTDNHTMENCIPFMSFGPQQDWVFYEYHNPIVNDPNGNPGVQIGYYDGVAYTIKSPPSWIGAQVVDHSWFTDAPADADAVLSFNLQSSYPAEMSGCGTDVYAAEFVDFQTANQHWEYSIRDQSYAHQQADNFGNHDLGSHVPLKAGRWQVVIASWDVSSGSAGIGGTGLGDFGPFATRASKFYCSVNDVKYDGTDLPVTTAKAVSGEADPDQSVWGPNDVVSAQTANWAGVGDKGAGLPNVNLSSPVIPCGPVCIPGPAVVFQENGNRAGTSSSAAAVQHVYLAHTVLFTGVVEDVGQEVIRRLFVDDDGNPTDPAVAIEYFGKLPEVAFHAATDWVTGTNVGSAGDFTVVGHPLKTKPSPKLNVA